MNNREEKRAHIITEIEAEFDEPIADIVAGMREQNCSWRTIAGALGINVLTLRRWRRVFGFSPVGSEKRIVEDNSREHRADRVARERGYKDFGDMFRSMRLSGMTIDCISEEIGIGKTMIRKYAPEDTRDIHIFTEKSREASRYNLLIARESAGKSSPWMRESIGVRERKANERNRINASDIGR